MATGMEMVLKSLRGFIPEHVWAAVEKNIISMGEKVAAIEKRLANIEEMQAKILSLHCAVVPDDVAILREVIAERKETLNGSSNSTEDGPRQL